MSYSALWRSAQGAKFCRMLHDKRNPLHSAVIHVPKSNVFQFGDPNSASPVLRDLQWTVNEGESWAVVASGSGGQKTTLFKMLLGHLRISPSPPEGLFPFLSLPLFGPRDPSTCISMVSFAHRPRSSGAAFYDYTARYGAILEEDRMTLRQNIFLDISGDTSQAKDDLDNLAEKLGLKALLDLPLITLSNGQTRRARILKAVLSKPELLLLDEPLTGLDASNRSKILSLLQALHVDRNPRVIMGLRAQDPVPEWVSHVAVVKDRHVTTGSKDDILTRNLFKIGPQIDENGNTHECTIAQVSNKKVLVDMKNVTVSYHGRKVLENINWTIREGDRYHLQGSNGSGKTTLLSLLTGDHPQSYTQLPPKSHLTLFGVPRSRMPTTRLCSLIGVVSPELFNAFPRRSNMTVWDAVGTGFDGGFVPLGPESVGIGLEGGLTKEDTKWRVNRVWEVLKALGPHTWAGTVAYRSTNGWDTTEGNLDTFAARSFVDLSAGEQSMVLLMRALVGRPKLVLLDEVWSGMDESMIAAARTYLRNGGVGENQAVVVISHWEDEVPWGVQDGVKRLQLHGEDRSE